MVECIVMIFGYCIRGNDEIEISTFCPSIHTPRFARHLRRMEFRGGSREQRPSLPNGPPLPKRRSTVAKGGCPRTTYAT